MLIICGAAVAAFGQVINFELVALDDDHFITWNENVISGLSVENVVWAFKTTFMSIWHPITWLSYQLESALFGADGHGWRHLTNLILHILASLLSYAAARQLFQNRGPAVLLSMLFALHPQHVQVVAWVSERKELLSAVFSFAAFVFYMRHVDWLREANGWAGMVTVLLYGGALMSKPSAMPLAIVIIAYDFLLRPGEGWKLNAKQLTFYGVVVGLAVGASVLTLCSQDKVQGNDLLLFSGSTATSLFEWLGMILASLSYYIQKLFVPWPLPLLVERPPTITSMMFFKDVLISAGFVGGACLFHRSKVVLFGLAWFLLFWLPTSGVIPIGKIYVADRYVYQAHLGAFILVAGVLIELLKTRPRLKNNISLICKAAAVVFALILIPVSARQTSFWRNTKELFAYEMRVNPESHLAPIYIAWYYQNRKQYELALQFFDRSIAIRPDNFYGYAYKGLMAQSKGDLELARSALEIAVTCSSKGDFHYIEQVYGNLAWVYHKLGQYRPAGAITERGLALYPDNEYLLEMKANLDPYLKRIEN
jgi:protein O-mannosyl-transferase